MLQKQSWLRTSPTGREREMRKIDNNSVIVANTSVPHATPCSKQLIFIHTFNTYGTVSQTPFSLLVLVMGGLKYSTR